MNSSKGIPWRRLAPDDGELLEAFLLRHEDYAAGFTGRLLRAGELRVPGPVSGGIFGLTGAGGLHGAVLLNPGGLVFPIFEEKLSNQQRAELAAFFKGVSIASILGAAFHVKTFEVALSLEPRLSIPYRSYYHPLIQSAGNPDSPPPAPGALSRLAGPRDLDALYPLHEAYEREEVITEIHRFDSRASRAALKRILETEAVAVAELGGTAVATARINARGLRTWQIGGVYVQPELRGRGWGRYVVGRLLRAVAEAGKGAGLFVKENNSPARGLYDAMGFRDVGPYRVDYL